MRSFPLGTSAWSNLEHDQRFTVPYIRTYLPCMHALLMHECLGCLDCLHVAAPNEEVLSPRNPQRHHATGRVLLCCGVGV